MEKEKLVADEDRTTRECGFMAAVGCVVPDASGGISLGERPRRPCGKRTLRSTRHGRSAYPGSSGGRGLRAQAQDRGPPARHARRRAVREMFNARHQAAGEIETWPGLLLRIPPLVS